MKSYSLTVDFELCTTKSAYAFNRKCLSQKQLGHISIYQND